jgi:hypothetical protein
MQTKALEEGVSDIYKSLLKTIIYTFNEVNEGPKKVLSFWELPRNVTVLESLL